MARRTELTGVASTIAKLKRFGSVGENRIKQITQVSANEIATEAQQNAPVNFGTLKQSINANQKDEFNWLVSVNVSYAPYVEFGTGIFVEVPTGWEEFAMQYYVNGKGYSRPQPFLIPAYYKGVRQYKIDLKDSLNYLVERFNSNSI